MRWPVALAALAVAFAWPMQVNGWNQNAHYALVRAVAVHGTPYIDRARHEIGDLGTGDVAEFEGHVYAAKAPGLALFSLPAFLAAEAAGMRTTGDPTRIIWVLHLWSVVLPGLALVALGRGVAQRLEAGTGTAVGVTLGLATLVLPFATLFFAHVLAATFAFAAFALLARERAGPERLALVFAAGGLAGLGVFVDYGAAIAGAIVGLYAIARPGFVRRGLVYAGGVLAGVVPLALFNVWAFGTPFHIAYEDYYEGGEKAGGLFGFGVPSGAHLHDLLLSTMGLLVLTPVVAAAVVGAALLLRTRRAEALVALGVAGAYYLWNASLSHASAFGGLGPPRYLFPLLPFLAVGLAAAYRRFPLATLALALVSAVQMVLITSTGPLAAYDGAWLDRLEAREFVQTGAALVGVTGWYTIALFFLAAAGAALAVRVDVRTTAELPVAVAATALWVVAAVAADNPDGRPPATAYVLAVAGAATVAVAVLALAARRTSQTQSTTPTPKSTAEQSGQVTA